MNEPATKDDALKAVKEWWLSGFNVTTDDAMAAARFVAWYYGQPEPQPQPEGGACHE